MTCQTCKGDGFIICADDCKLEHHPPHVTPCPDCPQEN